MDFTQFSLNIQWNNNNHLNTRLVQTKFNMRTLDFDNHHQSFGSWMSWSSARIRANVSWFSWPNSWLACNSAGHCLQFCDIIFRNTPTLNKSTGFRSGLFGVSFPVQWTRAQGSAGKRQCTGVNGVQALRPAETGSYSITGECSAVILVQYVITVIHSVILAPSCTHIRLKFQTLTSRVACWSTVGPGLSRNSSDRSAAERLMMVIKYKGPHVEFCLV